MVYCHVREVKRDIYLKPFAVGKFHSKQPKINFVLGLNATLTIQFLTELKVSLRHPRILCRVILNAHSLTLS